MKTIKRQDNETNEEYEHRKAAAKAEYLRKRREYYAAHAEQCRERCRKYRAEHLDEIKEREKKFYNEIVKNRKVKCNLKQREDETDDAFEKRVEAYKEKCRESHRKYIQNNKEKVKKMAKLYYETHKQRISELHKEYMVKRRKEQEAKRETDETLQSKTKSRRAMSVEERRHRALERYYANKDRIAVQRKERYKNNRQKELLKGKEYRKRNADRIKQLCEDWRNRNREYTREYARRHSHEFFNKSREEAIKLFSEQHGDVDQKRLYGFVYMVSNVCTDRFYIGQAKSIKHRYFSGIKSFIVDAKQRCSSKVLEDYNLFGEDSFTGPTPIAVAYSKIELDFLEAHYIKVYDSFNTGYNQTRGNILSVTRKLKGAAKK